MSLLFVKVALAPLIILAASLLAHWLGPRAAGLLIGLPTTALPFLLTIYLTHGTAAALTTAVGSITGQVICVLYCIAYAYVAPRLGPITSMLAAMGVAMTLGFATLALHNPYVTAVIALAVAVVGIATWPAGTSARAATATPAWSVPLRMVLVTLTVVGLAALEPLLGVVLAGALASLPTILLVMTPAVHWSQGPADAVTLVWGTLVSITGTVVFLVVLVATAPALGLWPALALALLALPVGPAATRALASRLRRAGLLRGLVGVEVGVLAAPLHRQQLGVDPAGVRELGR